MKIVIVSDLHAQLRTIEYLREIIDLEKPEALIVSGDITSSGEVNFAEQLFELFKNLEAVFLVCGNADLGEAKDFLETSEYSIDKKCKIYKKIKICGLSYPEETPLVGEDLGGSIFVTHRPPVKALLGAKYPNSPKYHISGHLHTVGFAKKHKATTQIQVPTLQDGKYALFVPEKDLIQFRSI